MFPIGDVPGTGNSMNTHKMYKQTNEQWQPVLNNSAVPYPILQLTSGQQVRTKYFIALLQHNMTTPIYYNYPSEDHTSQQLKIVTPTSEEGEEKTRNLCRNDWQV